MSARLAKPGDVVMHLSIWMKQPLALASHWIGRGWRSLLFALDEPGPDEADLLDNLRDREERVFEVRKPR